MNGQDLPQQSTAQLLALLDHVKATAGGAIRGDATKSFASSLSAQTESPMSSVEPSGKREAGEPATAHQHDALATLARERASLSNKVLQLEQQVSELEAIAQEKHMEIQRLRSDHEEIGPLREELRVLQAELRSKVDPKKAVRDGAAVSKEELNAVRQDLLMQERIISALEKDNELLMAEKKTLLTRLKQLEVGAAHSEAKHAIQQSGGASLNVSVQHAVEGGLTVDQLSRQLQEVRLALQKSQTLELELRLEIDSLKKEKREADRRAGEFDGTKAEQAALEARQLKVQLKRKDEAHDEVVRDMARKIAWYVDHQEFNRAQETLIQEQQETIQQLRLRVMEAESLVTKSGVARTDKDKQIRALQKQVAELEAAMREKNPNSIAQLIRSCQPPIQHSALFNELQTKVKSLTDELQQKDQAAQQMLDRMRVESDRVRLQYQQRLEKLEEEMKVRVLHAQTRKVKDLEKQLADARKYYSEKLRDQETTISLLRRGVHAAPHTSSDGAATVGGQPSSGRTSAASRSRMPKQDSTTTTSCSSTQTDASGVGGASNGDERNSLPGAGSIAKWTAATQALQQENTQLKQQLEAMAQSALTAASVVTAPMSLSSFHVASTLQAQVQLLQSELAVAKRLLVESQEEARVRVERLEDRIAGVKRDHEKELSVLQQQFAEERQRLTERHQAETKLLLDRFEAGHRLWSSPAGNVRTSPASAQQYLALVSERLQMLEYRQASKEIETQREMEEIRRVALFEVSLEKQKAELIVSQKNQEIERFRTELDILLNDLAQLRIAATA